MSCWTKLVVVAVVGANSLAFGQTRIGPATVRIGEVGEKPRGEDRESKPEISPSDKPAEAPATDITLTQMRSMFLELQHPDGRVRERARERLMGVSRAD